MSSNKKLRKMNRCGYQPKIISIEEYKLAMEQIKEGSSNNETSI
jgi:hypothetical protein